MAEIPGASRPAALRFALPCDLKQVRDAAQTAHRFLVEHGCSEEILTACDLALVEACNNAIKYAPEKARQQSVLVDILCTSRQIELRITDHTLGFEWPKRIELPDPESESGRGLYLIQSLMDSAHYLRSKGQNVLILRKSRPSIYRQIETQPRPPMDNDRLINDLLEELSSCYESLSAIFRYSTEQNKITDLKKFARRLLSDLSAIVGAEWFVFRTINSKSRLEVLAASERRWELPPLPVRRDGTKAEILELEA